MVRVGDLAKGLLLKESREVDVVLMCLKAPTKSLLDKVVTLLKEKLKEIAPDKLYEVKLTWILVPASWTWSYRYVLIVLNITHLNASLLPSQIQN